MEELPRGAIGELQRIGLAERLRNTLRSEEESFRGELAELIADTMVEVLLRNQPGRHANFFAIGGDSLSGQRVIHSMEHQLALEINPMLLFTCPTVCSLAERLDQLLNQELP